MSWSFLTGNRYHTQDTSYYCGAACAMMVLNEIGVAYSDLDQDDLYTSNHNHNVQSGWATDPHGLCYTLNDRRPSAFMPNYFVVYKRGTEAEGTRDVVHTLEHYKVSPAILVYHCQHWNVVCGVQTDVNPASGPYTVEGFWLNNPVWYNSPPPPPHDGSDTCGSGGAHGLAQEFVTYTEWQTNRFNGCAYDSPSGGKQWISVCDPEPPKIGLPRRPERRLFANGRSILPVKQALEFASKGLEHYRLAENKLTAAALRKGQLSNPQLVMRLDRPGEYYYLVPFGEGTAAKGFAQVDARFGEFQSYQILSRTTENWLMGGHTASRIRSMISRRIDGYKIELPEAEGRFTIHPGTYCISPTMVWKPCKESWSPHLPFYQITIGNHAIYVRIDGKIFNSLTTGRGV